MYPPGHVGIALALYAPVGLVLLLRGRPRLAVSGTVLVAGLTMLPDVDKWLPWFVHRGRTHTVWFALGTGVWLGAVAAVVGGSRQREGATALGFGAFGLCVGSLAVLAHLLGDVITPMGVRPLFPISEASYTFSLVFASDQTANARLFSAGCIATVAQVLVGVAFAPHSSGRTTLREAFRVFVRDIRYGPDGPPDAPSGSPRLAGQDSGPAGVGGESDD